MRHGVRNAGLSQHLSQERHERIRIALDLEGTADDGGHGSAVHTGHLRVYAADIPANRRHALNLARGALAHPGIEVAADANNNPGYRLDVLVRRVEVHDARAQHVSAADDGIGHECLTSALHRIEHSLVQCVEVVVDALLANLETQITPART